MYPLSINKLAQSEIEYWDMRAIRDFGNHTTLGAWYDRDHFHDDEWGMYTYRRFLSALPTTAPILEVGAGVVAKSLFLVEYQGFRDVTITDASATQLGISRAFVESIDKLSSTMYAACIFESLPFNKESFAAVFVHSSLHHASDLNAAVTEMVRCLQLGGLLIVGHEPAWRMHRTIRRLGTAFHLTERFTSETYSVADDETSGITVDVLQTTLARLGVKIVAVLPHWYTTGGLRLLCAAYGKVRHREPTIPRFVWTVLQQVDNAIARLPLVRECCFYVSIVGVKEKESA